MVLQNDPSEVSACHKKCKYTHNPESHQIVSLGFKMRFNIHLSSQPRIDTYGCIPILTMDPWLPMRNYDSVEHAHIVSIAK